MNNNSCISNVGFGNDFITVHIVLRDIQSREELTLYHGFLEVEYSFDNGFN
ncbi:unnamed protein product, partial [Rotaria sordida]